MKAVLCPVCNGVGKVASGFYNRSGDCSHWVSSGGNPEVCRSCNGKGWVEVGEDEPIYLFPNDEKPVPLDPSLIKFYEKKGYNVCPSCGGDRNSPAGTSCPAGSHFGTYCSL